jgi:hypothetical protein
MEAKIVCDNLLSSIKSSGLNFLITETPFSVNIVTKKTFIRAKDSISQSGILKSSNLKVKPSSMAKNLHFISSHSHSNTSTPTTRASPLNPSYSSKLKMTNHPYNQKKNSHSVSLNKSTNDIKLNQNQAQTIISTRLIPCTFLPNLQQTTTNSLPFTKIQFKDTFSQQEPPIQNTNEISVTASSNTWLGQDWGQP